MRLIAGLSSTVDCDESDCYRIGLRLRSIGGVLFKFSNNCCVVGRTRMAGSCEGSSFSKCFSLTGCFGSVVSVSITAVVDGVSPTVSALGCLGGIIDELLGIST